MGIAQLVFLRLLSVLLLGWATVSLSQGVEGLLLLISDASAVVSSFIGPLAALIIALALLVITSRIEGVHSLVDWLTSSGVAAAPILIRPDQPMLWLAALVPLCSTRLGIALIEHRSKNEIRHSLASASIGLRPIILGISLIISLGFGILTAEAIASGAIDLPPQLELQIERYLESPSKLPVGERLATEAEKLGAYVPLTATLAYLILFHFIIGPIVLQLSLWLSPLLELLFKSIGWLTFKEREVRQEYAVLD